MPLPDAPLLVYGRATSSNVQLVMWAIGELGLPYTRLDYGHTYGGLRSEAFRAMNPYGLVPVLRDGDTVIFESAAILRYLATRYGDGGAFWPADPAQRARVDMWAEWGKNTFARSFTGPIFWARVRTAADKRNETALALAFEAFERHLDALETQLGDADYMLGDALTVADIATAHVLYRWFDIDVPRKPRPVVEGYAARLSNRSAYREHVMISYEPLRAEGA